MFIMFLYGCLGTIFCIEGSELLMNPRQPSQQNYKPIIKLSFIRVFTEILMILHSFNILTGREIPPIQCNSFLWNLLSCKAFNMFP